PARQHLGGLVNEQARLQVSPPLSSRSVGNTRVHLVRAHLRVRKKADLRSADESTARRNMAEFAEGLRCLARPHATGGLVAFPIGEGRCHQLVGPLGKRKKSGVSVRGHVKSE